MAKSEERIDKWLWAMRIFKTRTISTEECKKATCHVLVFGKSSYGEPARSETCA